ncbi:MAG TPA: hypothetical protein VLA48_02785 [Nitrososphaeraceae archaeon]|nr:hypothetical protein [Nitrososphaeraceae archaeon]
MIDLNTCKKGDILISKHGERLTYVRKLNPEIDYYDHEVSYNSELLGNGTRTNDGFVMRNENARLESDHDIVEIIHI